MNHDIEDIVRVAFGLLLVVGAVVYYATCTG